MNSFKQFVESREEMASFLSGHFEDPFDSFNLLVFADWLEDHGDMILANSIRAVINGNENARRLLDELGKNIPVEVKFIGANYFNLICGDRYRFFRVKYNRIEEQKIHGKWQVVDKSSWTKPLISAAILLILRMLVRSLEISNDFAEKQLYSAFEDFIVSLHSNDLNIRNNEIFCEKIDDLENILDQFESIPSSCIPIINKTVQLSETFLQQNVEFNYFFFYDKLEVFIFKVRERLNQTSE